MAKWLALPSVDHRKALGKNPVWRLNSADDCMTLKHIAFHITLLSSAYGLNIEM